MIPYFIAAHSGTTDEDMLELALSAEEERLPRRPSADVSAVTDSSPPLVTASKLRLLWPEMRRHCPRMRL